MTEKTEHHLLLQWLIFSGVVLFGSRSLSSEVCRHSSRGTRASYVWSWICLTPWPAYTAHGGLGAVAELDITRRVLRLVREHVGSGVTMDGTLVKLGGAVTAHYVYDLLRARSSLEKQDNQGVLAEILISGVKGPHEVGWFITDLMIKLGLVGTIVGLIFMLGSISEISTADVTSMQRALKQMSSGMGTALYTTLVGLTGSMLLAAQYTLLDRAGDHLIEKTLHLAEIELAPRLAKVTP